MAERELCRRNVDFGTRNRNQLVRPPPPPPDEEAEVVCRRCRVQFLPSQNHDEACRRHENDYTEYRPNVGLWACCKSRNPREPGCVAGRHIAAVGPATQNLAAQRRYNQATHRIF